MADRFVSESLTPDPGSFDTTRMATGAPGLPRRFTWRRKAYQISEVLESWTGASARAGETETYVRRHWYRVRTACGTVMTLYCDRQSRSHKRWWVYSVDETL